MNKIHLILGGARSGKSKYAEELAANNKNKIYIATSESLDREMETRINAHKTRRGPDWQTIESPIEIAKIIKNSDHESTILIDCMTIWLSNLMLAEKDTAYEIEKLLETLQQTKNHIIMVSNEVGLSIVPENALARRFRDEQGRLNQALAKTATNVVFIAAGLPLILKEEC